MNETQSTSIYGFLHDLTEQLTGRFATMSRPMIIYIQTDYNSTDLHPKQIEYAIKEFKEQIETNFSLISTLTARALFTFFYGLVILVGLFSNLLMIYAFYKAEKLRTFRNVFIINLAIRYKKNFNFLIVYY